jgi:hypothetical protein
MNKVERMHAQMIEEARGEDRENLLQGMRILGIDDPRGKMALRKAFRRSHPEWTERQLDLAVYKDVPHFEGSLKESFRRAHPEWSEEQLRIAVEGR